jgi:hypothetical protein
LIKKLPYFLLFKTVDLTSFLTFTSIFFPGKNYFGNLF